MDRTTYDKLESNVAALRNELDDYQSARQDYARQAIKDLTARLFQLAHEYDPADLLRQRDELAAALRATDSIINQLAELIDDGTIYLSIGLNADVRAAAEQARAALARLEGEA